MKRMKVMEKLRRRWKRYAAFVVCVSIISVSMCGCYDDYDDYDEYDRYEEYDDTASGAAQSMGVATDETSVDISQYFSDGAIREPQVQLKGDGSDTVTVMIYMNGSNLESDDEEASQDLAEIVAAGSSDQVNILVQTMGTRKWSSRFGVASDRSQIYKVDGNGLTLLKDDLGQKDCTEEETLTEFISWGAQNFPADRYILQFWDHGGGPVYGFGYDEWNSDESAALTIDEMQSALKNAGVYFDFVGMDCCLMSCMEVCAAFYDYCDYMILSEDFESGIGWYYTDWVKALYQNPSMPTLDLGKKICDDMIEANETDENGDKGIMAMIDQGMLKVLFAAWTDFAYTNEKELLGTNYSRVTTRAVGGRVHPAIANRGWFDDFDYLFYDSGDDASMAEYYVTDIMEVAKSVDAEQSAALSAALNVTLSYVKTTEADAGLTGIAVSLPYGDTEYYDSMKPIFTNIGLDTAYVEWLGKFTGVTQESDETLHDDWDDDWEGWDDYEYEDDFTWWDWFFSDYDDEYWEDDYDFDSWDYDDSWNTWSDENDWEAPSEWDDADDWDDDWEDDWFYDDWYYDDDEYWDDEGWW